MKSKVKDNEERTMEPRENANSDILAKLNDGSIGAVDDVKLKGADGKKIINIMFTIVSIGIVLYTLYIGLFGMPTVMVHRISHVCVILFAAPMVYPSKIFKQGTKAELIFNIFCTVVGVAAALYALTNWMKFFSYSLTTLDIVMLTILVIAVLESTRRSIGIPMVIIAFVAIAYCLVGPYMPGALAHKGYEFSRIVNMICVGTEGLFSSTLGTASVEIAAFLIFRRCFRPAVRCSIS
ncbi:MAG: hypothetical protein ACLTK0_00105 [Anaerovoracaceae bacterium]